MNKTYADMCLERAEKATSGPWEVCSQRENPTLPVGIEDRQDNPIARFDKIFINLNKNTDFIAHARTDVPELARRLKIACEALRKADVPDWPQLLDLVDELEEIPGIKYE